MQSSHYSWNFFPKYRIEIDKIVLFILDLQTKWSIIYRSSEKLYDKHFNCDVTTKLLFPRSYTSLSSLSRREMMSKLIIETLETSLSLHLAGFDRSWWSEHGANRPEYYVSKNIQENLFGQSFGGAMTFVRHDTVRSDYP